MGAAAPQTKKPRAPKGPDPSEQQVDITTLFDNTALQRRRLGTHRGGHISASSWALFALGLVGMGVALFGLLSGRAGLGTLTAMIACGTLVFTMGRAQRERRSPHFLVGDGVDVDLPVT
ncbi:MAG: hypothetical protein JRH20_15490, partial [Deltaproteobacteria bacterium]|nr:hypothetical protein [Deltaproteobacteria bacterium]